MGVALTTQEQAETEEVLRSLNVGLCLGVLGKHNALPKYPIGFHCENFPVMWEAGRGATLHAVLPQILTAFSQGQFVLIHCSHSFHRGPMALAAVVTCLFWVQPQDMLYYISGLRHVYEPT